VLLVRGIITWLFALTLLGGGLAKAEEFCDPWVPPPPKVQPSKPPSAPAAPRPEEFWVIRGGTTGPEIVLLGDSLTTPNFGQTVSTLLGDRQYAIYALGGRAAETLSDLFDDHDLPPDAVGIIWIGRNNNPADVDVVLHSIERAAARFASGKYLVLNVLSGRNADEQPGGGKRVKMDALNEAIATAYGDRVIAVRPLVACSDFEDHIHLLKPAQDKVAQAVSEAVRARGW
jgi:hypothetical protein